jgi:hypothetical protein
MASLCTGVDHARQHRQEAHAMNASRTWEYRITRQLLQGRENRGSSSGDSLPGHSHLAEMLITTTAVTVLLVLTGSYLQELLWVGMGAGSVLAMGIRAD